tara:strand:+ start:15800 stop:16144 length:345 start_codon:yes stop_codon:yes gene_type:complete
MSDIEVIEETPVSLHDLRAKLEEIKKRDKELNFRGNKTEGYLNALTKMHSKKLEDLEKEIDGLGVSRLKPRHIKKIIDIQPVDLDSLRATLSGENITLKQEDLEKITATVKKHV